MALVGPRAAGKTAVGRALAAELGWRFVDADRALGQRAGMPAGAVLERRGEPAFRRLEEQVSGPLLRASRTVVALGGGAVLSPVLRRALRRPGLLTVLLLATPSALTRRIRVARTRRPPLTGLSRGAEVEALLRARLPLYRQVAHVEWDTTRRRPGTVAREIAARVHGGHAPAGPPRQG